MPDSLEGRRLPFHHEVMNKGTKIAEYRNTGWYKHGDEIVQITRSVPTRDYYVPGKYITKVVQSIPKYARMIGKAISKVTEGSGSLGPPDVRKASERKMISKRKPGQWGGAGR